MQAKLWCDRVLKGANGGEDRVPDLAAALLESDLAVITPKSTIRRFGFTVPADAARPRAVSLKLAGNLAGCILCGNADLANGLGEARQRSTRWRRDDLLRNSTREELTALIEGRLSTASAKDELVKLATCLIVEEALEGEAGDALGRDYYEHGAQPDQGYRNGYRTGTAEDGRRAMEYSVPQIAGRDQPFRSAIREHLKGHTQGLDDLAIEMLARGLSVRDIEDAFKDENGRLLLSKTAVSQLGERLWEDYQAFATRDLE